ncbi:hypothetical protein LJ737_13350 [Hymenobacter sp. 15J16-1T3B]|uniref:hypothetical protein n=1 Tax=Hymenobacter sp. 15J16-1T3B TaxID=2886941 RepID=UPI001D11A338|nr:hypothetical protein [Hymenobacter sp. 15J16-1T3B]MCC3158228.1 hypothetical protein [Hymenobacter sp. 15J16-1T3B]
MEPTPQPDPKQPTQPNPAATTLPTKGSADSQSADKAPLTNQPRPDSVPDAGQAPPAAPEAEADKPTAESQAADDAAPAADPSAADIQPDTRGDADPGASNTGDVQPL